MSWVESVLSAPQKNTWILTEKNKALNPELTLIQSTQMVVSVIFTNHWAIAIICKKKKGTLPEAQNNIIIQGAEIPLLPLSHQTLTQMVLEI